MYKLLITITLLGLSGCTSLGKLIPPSQQKAISLEPTELFADLKNLPKPVGSIPVSVYSFRDQTGQYKPQTNVSSFSTAVTQGANSILVQALHESAWLGLSVWPARMIFRSVKMFCKPSRSTGVNQSDSCNACTSIEFAP